MQAALSDADLEPATVLAHISEFLSSHVPLPSYLTSQTVDGGATSPRFYARPPQPRPSLYHAYLAQTGEAPRHAAPTEPTVPAELTANDLEGPIIEPAFM
jgi:hypothetical protein